jgi:hypothetical protein
MEAGEHKCVGLNHPAMLILRKINALRVLLRWKGKVRGISLRSQGHRLYLPRSLAEFLKQGWSAHEDIKAWESDISHRRNGSVHRFAAGSAAVMLSVLGRVDV